MVAVQAQDLTGTGSVRELFNRVFHGETVLVSGNESENAVLLPKADFDEYIRAKNNMEYLEKLERGFAAIERGEPGIKKTWAELETLENE